MPGADDQQRPVPARNPHMAGAQHRDLRKPPITEAILDVRIAPAPTQDLSVLRAAVESLRLEYPDCKELQAFEAVFGIPNQGPPVHKSLGVTGFLLRTNDGTSAVQFRLDGFTFNRLAPYDGWDHVLPRALRAWGLYVSSMRPQAVTRIALRYINNVLGPYPGENFADYLTAAPAGPDGGPELMTGFLSQVQLREPDSVLSVALAQSTDAPTETGRARVIVDIDAFDSTGHTTDSAQLARTWEALRRLKNRVFFASITEKGLEPYA